MTDEPSAIDSWSIVLDELQARLDGQRAAFAEGRYGDIVSYELPEHLGPVPAQLEARALDLLSECTALEIAVADRMESVARRRRVLDANGHDRATSMFIDHSL